MEKKIFKFYWILPGKEMVPENYHRSGEIEFEIHFSDWFWLSLSFLRLIKSNLINYQSSLINKLY